METELIRKIAEEIVTAKILLNWKFYGIVIVLTVITFAVYTFVRSFLSKKGEQLARKSDINAILDELRKTTRTTEEIKSNIEKEIWIKKEFNILRRQKLEELLVWLYQYKHRVHQEVKEKYFSDSSTDEIDPFDRATAIHKLYFPELDEEMAALYTAHAVYSQWLAEGIQQKLERMKAGNKAPMPNSDHMDKYGDHYKRIIVAIMAVENKAKVVMDELRNI